MEEKNESTQKTTNVTGFAIASLVLGICAILFCAVPIFGFILGVVALVISIIAMKKVATGNQKKGMAIAGFVTSIIGFIFSLFVTCFLLLGIGLYMNNAATEVISSSDLTQVEAKAFNSKFEAFEGNISYGNAKALIQLVRKNNSNNEHYVSLLGDQKVKSSHQSYDVVLDYDSKGFVNRVIIND